jgi:hypothetical protein
VGPLSVDAEFIEQNAKANLCKPRQKFAPYTKSERKKRRAEVYRLHFEHGWPAVRIATTLKVHRNTVNEDLRLLYDQAIAEYNPSRTHLEDYIPKQLFRLESQRDRLGSYLADTKDIGVRLAIERQIADNDFRLLNAIAKAQYDSIRFWSEVVERVNELAEDQNLEGRYTNMLELFKISQTARKKLDHVKREAGIE